MPRYRCSNAFIGGALIAAMAILLSTMPHAQQGGPEVNPPLPGMSWGSPPVQGEWEPADQGGAAQSGAQDHANARDQNDEAAQEQVLIAQQDMAEQARRMADFMFW